MSSLALFMLFQSSAIIVPLRSIAKHCPGDLFDSKSLSKQQVPLSFSELLFTYKKIKKCNIFNMFCNQNQELDIVEYIKVF